MQLGPKQNAKIVTCITFPKILVNANKQIELLPEDRNFPLSNTTNIDTFNIRELILIKNKNDPKQMDKVVATIVL